MTGARPGRRTGASARSHRLGPLIGLLSLTVVLGACATRVPVPVVAGLDDPQAAWTWVLGTHVLNEIMRLYAADFLAQAPSLIAYVSRYRRESIPAAHRVRFIPCDWTVNQR